jgi:hypothetical protein
MDYLKIRDEQAETAGADYDGLPTLGDFFQVRRILAEFAATRVAEFRAYMDDRLTIKEVDRRMKSDADALNALFLGRIDHPRVVALPGWNRPQALGAALVGALGLNCRDDQAVGEAANLMALDVVRLWRDADPEKLNESALAIIDGYASLMIGKTPAAN